jgi:hypothetical protein
MLKDQGCKERIVRYSGATRIGIAVWNDRRNSWWIQRQEGAILRQIPVQNYK